jgi:hypothetical protein
VRSQFSYAILRVVPRIERGECLNAGVVMFCRECDFLRARIALDRQRLGAFAADISFEAVRMQLEGIVRIAEGDPAAGPVAALPMAERFGWLVAPSSTVIQPSEVHSGLSEDPARTFEQLFADLVL